MNMRAAVAVLLVVALGVWFSMVWRPAETDAGHESRISTEPDDGVGAALPARGSEDLSHILRPAAERVGIAERNGPDETTEWVIELVFPEHRVPEKSDLWHVFGVGWSSSVRGPTVYVYDGQQKQWVSLVVARFGVPLSRAAVVLKFLDRSEVEARSIPERRFASLLERVGEGARKLGADVLPSLSPARAADRSREIHELKESDYGVEVVLRAPEGKEYTGKEVWDVMLCLGMLSDDMYPTQWFRLPHPSKNRFGSDLLRVYTKTQPTYFRPEVIALGVVRVEDLRFRYSVPRVADPQRVLERILRAVEYSQRRLGGTLTASDGNPFNTKRELARVRAIVDRLAALGFMPGDESTLRTF